jgi:hypothetical protein
VPERDQLLAAGQTVQQLAAAALHLGAELVGLGRHGVSRPTEVTFLGHRLATRSNGKYLLSPAAEARNRRPDSPLEIVRDLKQCGSVETGMAVDSTSSVETGYISPTADALLIGALTVLFALAGVVFLVP